MHFRWLSAQDIPPKYDLRRRGWQLVPAEQPDDADFGDAIPLIVLADPADGRQSEPGRCPPDRERRRRTLLLGIEPGEERARFLDEGFGDAIGTDTGLAELEARVRRVARMARSILRWRDHGRLRLDLQARDAFVEGRAIGLHPREFELIWRLAEDPGVPATKARLLSDVWRQNHVPETNSLAVHISRLRGKLAVAGLDGMVRTTPAGAYFLAPAPDRSGPAVPFGQGPHHLEAYVLADGEAA